MKLKLSSDPAEDKARKASAALLLLGLLGLGRSQHNPQAWAIGGGGQTYLEPVADVIPGGSWIPPYVPIVAAGIFVGGTANHPRKYRGSDLAYLTAATVGGHGSMVILTDDDYVYSYGPANTVWRFNRSDLVYTGLASPSYGDGIRDMAKDATHIYVVGLAVIQRIRKYLISDLSYVAQSPQYGGYIEGIDVDDDHAFIGGSSIDKVYKYLKSDLSYVTMSADLGGTIRAVKVDDTHVYAAVDSVNRVIKLLKSDLSTVTQSPIYTESIRAVAVDDDHVYAGGYTLQRVRKYLKSDMSYVAQSADYGDRIWAVEIDDDHVYYGGYTNRRVVKIRKSDMGFVAQSPQYPNEILSIGLGL